VLIGLIAQHYVRVWHPVGTTTVTWYGRASQAQTLDNSGRCNLGNATTPAVMNSITITAAILALKKSFLVDNWRCGTQMTGTLNVTGAIAQNYRGPVSCSTCFPPSPGTATGYVKNYVYDTRLRYRSPPAFLNPVQSSWRTVRVQEQAGATKITGR